MNEQQMEEAARKLCEIRGWKPDSLDHMSTRFGDPMKTALEHCEREIIDFYQVAQAIDHAFAGKEFP